MASINDFKIIASKSIKFFDLVYKGCSFDSSLSDADKARNGFYHLVLEAVTGVTDYNAIKEMIIDTSYNLQCLKKVTDDLGIDAVCFNEEEHSIYLFNFKYRTKFKPGQTQEESTLSRSQKFLEYMISENDLSSLDEKVRDKIQLIRDDLESTAQWNLTLFVVSNEDEHFVKRTDPFISILEKSYGMGIKSLNLDDIVSFTCEGKKEKECVFSVSVGDFLKYDRDSLGTSTSYVVKMNLIDVVRILCTNDELARKYDIEKDEQIIGSQLEYSLLYDNVRGFLGETSFNQNIKDSLKDCPDNFFMYNNGLTIITADANVISYNSEKKYKFTLKNYQLVNGGQTVHSIYEFLNKQENPLCVENLRKAHVLVRIFKVESDEETDDSLLKCKIAEYTNSQNAIKPSDLKSVDYRQIQIERYLETKGILYARKVGDVGKDDKAYTARITMEQLGKILYVYAGYPERVSSQRKKMFVEYYDTIFSKDLELEGLEDKINLFEEIKRKVNECTEQRACYILYALNKKALPAANIEMVDALITTALGSYKPKTQASDARKLIQKAFKEHFDHVLESITGAKQ